jgi:hypothetical protein
VIPLSDGIPARRFPWVNVALIVANFAVWIFYELPASRGSSPVRRHAKWRPRHRDSHRFCGATRSRMTRRRAAQNGRA